MFCFDAAGCGQSEGLEVVLTFSHFYSSISSFLSHTKLSVLLLKGVTFCRVRNGRHVNSTAASVKESSICEVVTTGLLNSSMAAGISRNTQTLKPCASMAVERRGRCRVEVLSFSACDFLQGWVDFLWNIWFAALAVSQSTCLPQIGLKECQKHRVDCS